MAQNKFAEIITATRKRRGLSQKQAALELGISQALLSHYEKGIRECNLDFLVKLSDYYGVSCDYLLGHSTAKSSKSASAQRQRGMVRSVEALMLLAERSDDKKLVDSITAYFKNCIYRGLKLFDGICKGMRFESDDTSISYALAEAETQFAIAYREAWNLKDNEIPLHESSLESPMNIINELEGNMYEKGLI